MNADQLPALPVKDLRALATGRGIPGAAKMRKDQLVEALAKALTSERREPPAPAPQVGSSQPPQQPQAWQPAPPQHGLPVPEAYGRDRLILLVQDPNHIFAYWEVSEATLAGISGGTAVLILHTDHGDEQREVDLRGGNYYLAVAPRGTYTAELAIRDGQGRLRVIAKSNPVSTPAAGPSWRTDEEWIQVDERFDELMSLAGTPGTGGSSGSGGRFLNRRQLNVRQIGVESENQAGFGWQEVPAAGALPSSQSVGRPESFSSHVLSLSSHNLAAGAGAGYGGSSMESYSSHQLSSRALSSRSLSSRSLSSGSLVQGGPEEQYPVDGVFACPPTGMPKAAEGLPVGPAPAMAQGAFAAPTSAPAPTPAPAAPNAAAPAPAHDPLAFIGAPKPAAQRKPKPKL